MLRPILMRKCINPVGVGANPSISLTPRARKLAKQVIPGQEGQKKN